MHLIVDEKQGLREKEQSRYPGGLRVAASVVSFVFHPLFIPIYITWFIISLQSHLFPGLDGWNRNLVLIQTAVIYTLFPAVTTVLLKALGFIGSVMLRTQRDRIIPYIACGVFYFWGWYVSRNIPEYPQAMTDFRFAIFLASSIGLVANIYGKVSLHMIAMGVVSAFLMGFAFRHGGDAGFYISMGFLVTGVVGTARLIVSDHTPAQIYAGFLIGAFAQAVSFWV